MALPTDNISTTTLQLIRRRLADNVFKANPTLAWLLAKGRVKVESGGKRIDEPLMYATNSTVQSYSGYDRLNVAPTEELSSAQYTWKQAAVSISISGLETLQNNGSEAVFNLLKTKVQIAEKSLKQYLDEKIHQAATSKTSKDILGLDELIDDDDTAWATVGGINSSTYTWWKNQLGTSTTDGAEGPGFGQKGDVSEALNVGGASRPEFVQAMSRLYNLCGKGITRPDLIITTQFLYEMYENYAVENMLRVKSKEMLDLGFQNQMFKDTTMMWNENIKSATDKDLQHMYMLTSEHLGFTLHSQRNFVISQFVSPWDQDAKVAQILFAGNMTTNNRRHQGVIVFDTDTA